MKEVRGDFYKAAILPVIKWLEQVEGRYSEDEDPCPEGVWEYKRLLCKSTELSHYFTKFTADFHEPLTWLMEFGSHLNILGFKCCEVYDSRLGTFRKLLLVLLINVQ